MRYVRIRGLNQNLTTVTMDGNRLANGASAGANRAFQFQTVNSETIERLEVVKLPTTVKYAPSRPHVHQAAHDDPVARERADVGIIAGLLGRPETQYLYFPRLDQPGVVEDFV